MIHKRRVIFNNCSGFVLVLFTILIVGNALTTQTTANCPDNIPITEMNITVQSNRFQKVINQLNVLSPNYQQKIKNYFYQNQNSNVLDQSTTQDQAYFLFIAYGIAFFICFLTFRLCFSNKSKRNRANACKFYCWQVFGAFLINFIVILLVLLMGVVLWNLLPQIKQQLKYSKCSIYNSLDTVLYGNTDQKWAGFSPLYKQYQRVNKFNQKILANLERQQSKMQSINQIIIELANKQESHSLILDIDIPLGSKYHQQNNKITTIDLLNQLNDKINKIKLDQIKSKNAVIKLRTNFSELTTLQPIRQKIQTLRRNLYEFDVYEYKGFNGSTSKRLEKLYFVIIAVSVLIIIGIIIGGAFSKFQSLTFVKFGYWTYWLIFFCLIYVSFYSFFYWSFTFVSCSASSTAFKNQDNFHNLGKFYQPLKKLNVCFYGDGNFAQKNLQINSLNQILEIIKTNSQYVQSQLQLKNLIESWKNSFSNAKTSGSQEQRDFNAVLNEKLSQIALITSIDKNQQSSSTKNAIQKMRISLMKIQDMKKNTNCNVFKKQLKFMQTTVCDNLTVLQFNNFIFTLILMVILFVALLVTPFGINILDQMKQAKSKSNRNDQESNCLQFGIEKADQEYQQAKSIEMTQQN